MPRDLPRSYPLLRSDLWPRHRRTATPAGTSASTNSTSPAPETISRERSLPKSLLLRSLAPWSTSRSLQLKLLPSRRNTRAPKMTGNTRSRSLPTDLRTPRTATSGHRRCLRHLGLEVRLMFVFVFDLVFILNITLQVARKPQSSTPRRTKTRRAIISPVSSSVALYLVVERTSYRFIPT